MNHSKLPLIPRSAIWGALLFSSALTIGAFAQNPPPSSSGSSMNDNAGMTKLGWSDKHFLSKAAKDGTDEVAISRIAAQRATNPEVKAYAQMLVNDHEKLNQQVMALANTENVSLPSDLQKRDDKLESKWQKKESGTDFDKAYLKQMISDHESAISLFGKAAKSDNAEVASLASKALPQLQEHHTRAVELRKQLGD